MPEMPETNEPISSGHSEELTKRKVTLLTDDNPIEAALLEYATEVNKDNGLTNADQIELVKAVVYDLPYAKHNLIEGNRGLLAAIAYPFRAYSHDNTDDLMDTASLALLEAAIRFDPNTTHSFTDFAAPIVQEALAAQSPWVEGYERLENKKNPIYSIIRFASQVKKAKTESELLRKSEQDQELLSREQSSEPLAPFTPSERNVLPFINLKTQEIMEKSGLSRYDVNRAIGEAGKRVGVSGRKGLSSYLLERGFVFDVTEPRSPLNELFNARQMVFAQNLHLPNKELEQVSGVAENSIGPTILKLQQRSGARTRVDLMLMARMYDSGELRVPDERTRREKLASKLGLGAINIEDLRLILTRLSERQHTFVEAYYLDDQETDLHELAGEHDITIQAARDALKNAVSRIRKIITRDKEGER